MEKLVGGGFTLLFEELGKVSRRRKHLIRSLRAWKGVTLVKERPLLGEEREGCRSSSGSLGG